MIYKKSSFCVIAFMFGVVSSHTATRSNTDCSYGYMYTCLFYIYDDDKEVDKMFDDSMDTIHI